MFVCVRECVCSYDGGNGGGVRGEVRFRKKKINEKCEDKKD